MPGQIWHQAIYLLILKFLYLRPKCLSLTCLRGSILHVLNCSATGTTKLKLFIELKFQTCLK